MCFERGGHHAPLGAGVDPIGMNVIRTALPEVLLIEPRVFGDDRGFFFESFNERVFREKTDLDARFVQDNHSRSAKNVLRGLHYQIQQPQGKLVRCIVGEVFDVAVDLRRTSPNFGSWVGFSLSAENKRMAWIPPGFGHGFVVVSDVAEVLYKTTDYWAPEFERTLLWNDPDLGINWPLSGEPILAAKDKAGSRFRDGRGVSKEPLNKSPMERVCREMRMMARRATKVVARPRSAEQGPLWDATVQREAGARHAVCFGALHCPIPLRGPGGPRFRAPLRCRGARRRQRRISRKPEGTRLCGRLALSLGWSIFPISAAPRFAPCFPESRRRVHRGLVRRFPNAHPRDRRERPGRLGVAAHTADARRRGRVRPRYAGSGEP